MKIFVLTVSSLIILFLAGNLFGQNQTAKPIKAITDDGKKVILNNDNTWEYEIESNKNKQTQLDENSQINKRLQLPFTGDNLTEVVDFVDSIKSKIEKSEFETEAQYRIRIKDLIAQTKFRNKLLSEIVFVMSPTFYYNPEKKTFSVSFSDFTPNIESKTHNQNKFKTYMLQISKRRSLLDNFDYTSFIPELSFNMLPERAKEVKQNLRVAIYGFPVKVQAYINAQLYFVPTKYIVFDNTTGEIYSETTERELLDVSKEF